MAENLEVKVLKSTKYKMNTDIEKHGSSEKLETTGKTWELSREIEASLKKFIRNTSFHGVQYMGSSKSRIKRAMWTLFVFGSLVALVFQIQDRIQYYNSGPVSVNVRINYNHSLKFPSITICNQNTFRASRAAELGLHELVEHLFAGSEPVTPYTLAQLEAGNLTIQDIYTLMSHKKDDLILKCQWKKKTCGPDDFRVVLTDHGVCLTFHKDDDMFVSSSGVESGLRLVLNAEQYEYMTGPHDAAGVKILLHDSQETPLVYQLGEAISTGTHAFVGIKTTSTQNLPGKYGGCANKRLTHTEFYSSDECYLECLSEYMRDQCGCRDMYLPSLSDTLPVCSLEKYITCFIPMKDQLLKQTVRQCSCPVPCQRTIYDTAVSYASISNNAADKLLPPSEAQSIKDKLLTASEAVLVIGKRKRDHLIGLKDKLVYESSRIFETISNVTVFIEAQIGAMNLLKNNSDSFIQLKDKLFRYQAYIIQKNFLRAREAMEERTLLNVVDSFTEFGLQIHRQIMHLASVNDSYQREKDGFFNMIIDTLEVRKEVNELARRNISELFDAFENGTGIFNYSFENIHRSHNQYIVPKTLLKYSLQRNDLVKYHVIRLKDSVFNEIRNSLDAFIDAAQNANSGQTFNKMYLDNIQEEYYKACREYMFSKSVVYTEAFDYPVNVINEKLETFRNQERELYTVLLDLEQNLRSIMTHCNDFNTDVYPMLNLVLRRTKNYFNAPSLSFMELTDSFVKDGVRAVIILNDLFEVIKTRDQLIQDTWNILVDKLINVWKVIINDADMLEYYHFANLTDFLRPFDTIKSEIGMLTTLYTGNVVTSRAFIGGFNSAFDDFLTYAENFKRSVEINGNFIRENILQVDIFYRQLSYEQIEQQKAYDFFALICDVGGAMGLFIGASMLTIVEVLEFVFHQIRLCSSLPRTFKNRQSYTVT